MMNEKGRRQKEGRRKTVDETEDGRPETEDRRQKTEEKTEDGREKREEEEEEEETNDITRATACKRKHIRTIKEKIQGRVQTTASKKRVERRPRNTKMRRTMGVQD